MTSSGRNLNETAYDRERAEERLWALARDRGIGRRRFLELLGVTGLGTLVGSCGRSRREPASAPGTSRPSPTAADADDNLGGWVKPIGEDDFILHKTNAEMRWERMADGYTTPNARFFVRNHFKTARVDRAAWRLQVSGPAVTRPLELSYDELVSMPGETTVTRFIECAGNARVFFDEVGGRQAEGTQWRLGAIGVAEWTGVPLGAVLERAGVQPTARDVMPVGLDQVKVRRPIPLEKAMADDTLLVYGMNGEDLPPDHGGPVRVLVPGWIGVANVKWVGQIEVSDQPLYSDWNTTAYVLIGPGYFPAGQAKGPVLSSQVVKSALELPWPATVPAGRQTLRGRSWSGGGSITAVECRIDQEPWRPARLEGPNEPLAWARWSFEWDAPSGEHTVRVRAADSAGTTQPDTVPFNEQGYLYGGVVAHPVTVTPAQG